jgi:hypothetical protein
MSFSNEAYWGAVVVGELMTLESAVDPMAKRRAPVEDDSVMKVLIQDDATQMYVADEGRWTESAQEARDFTMSLHARSVAQKLNLKRFRVLFYFPDLDYKIVVSDG